MAGNDVYLRPVPSDADRDDLRLYDPTQPDAGGSINGAVSATLAGTTQSATGRVLIQGQASQTLGAATQAATGRVLVQGQVSATLGAATQSSTGRVVVKATVAQTVASATQSATGKVIVGGQAAATLAGFTQSATGTLPIQGAASITLGDATQSALGSLTGVTPAPAPDPAGSAGGGGGAVLTYRLNPRRFEVRKAIDRARRELERARTPKAKKRRLRKAVEMVAEVFDMASGGYADVGPQISLKPLAEAMAAVEMLARRIDAHAEMNAAQAAELQGLFVAYQRELERIERQEEEDAVAALMALSTVIH